MSEKTIAQKQLIKEGYRVPLARDLESLCLQPG
jgi:hypothetical protein